jgi:hypothetical protein
MKTNLKSINIKKLKLTKKLNIKKKSLNDLNFYNLVPSEVDGN